MKKFSKLAAKKQDNITTFLTRENYHGKRKHSVKAALCESALMLQDLDPEMFDLEGMIAHVDSLKPVKVEGEKATKKPEHTPEELAELRGQEFTKDPTQRTASGVHKHKLLITSAQNSTELNHTFLSQLEKIASIEVADLIVVGTKYNPDTLNSVQKRSEAIYPPALNPYLLTYDLVIGDLVIYHDSNVIATAKQPINAAKQLNTGELFSIVPHNKQQLKTLPRPLNAEVITAVTTGTVSRPNYSGSRAGAEAAAAHVYGAFYVNLETGEYSTVTQGDDGSVYFGNYSIDADLKVTTTPDRTNTVVLGDVHAEALTESDIEEYHCILALEAPHLTVLHDVLHMQSANPHEAKNKLSLYKHKDGSIDKDLSKLGDVLTGIGAFSNRVYLVESNHNDMIQRIIADVDHRPDPKNAKLYHELSFLALNAIDNKDHNFNVLQQALLINGFDFSPIWGFEWGKENRPKSVNGWLISNHGHNGVSGSRGSPMQLSRITQKMVSGHTHSPEISGNNASRTLTVGTCALNQGYNERGGFTTWGKNYVVIYPNGTASQKTLKLS